MAATYEIIATTTLSSATSTVNFTSITAGYTDLVLVLNLGAVTAGVGVYINLNTDTNPSGTNYSVTNMVGTGSTKVSNQAANYSAVLPSWYVGVGASIDFVSTVNFMNYSNTTTFKTVLARANLATSETDPGTVVTASLWRNTSAINAIRITSSSNMITGSTFTLYGIKAGS